jgi:hypothetical protein
LFYTVALLTSTGVIIVLFYYVSLFSGRKSSSISWIIWLNPYYLGSIIVITLKTIIIKQVKKRYLYPLTGFPFFYISLSNKSYPNPIFSNSVKSV